MRALILGLSLVALPAQAADQFDLICKGSQKTALEGPSAPHETRYRVDLAAKLYCVDDCKSVRSIASVTPAQIEFEDVKEGRINIVRTSLTELMESGFS